MNQNNLEKLYDIEKLREKLKQMKIEAGILPKKQ